MNQPMGGLQVPVSGAYGFGTISHRTYKVWFGPSVVKNYFTKLCRKYMQSWIKRASVKRRCLINQYFPTPTQ